MSARVQLVVNPEAGGYSATRVLDLREALRRQGARVTLAHIGPGRQLRIEDDADLLVVAGGDGTLRHAAMALLAPNVNSYRRISRFQVAPINVHWGYDNRTAGLRVPMSGPEDRRVENRLAGADANPYLASAASLACGYLGMVQGLSPTDPITGSAHDLPFSLPRSLDEAIRLLRECEPLIEIFGDSFVSAFTLVKEAEYEVFLQVISSWEREHLLLNV